VALAQIRHSRCPAKTPSTGMYLVSVAADEAVDGVLAAPPERGLERLAVHLRHHGELVGPLTVRSEFRSMIS